MIAFYKRLACFATTLSLLLSCCGVSLATAEPITGDAPAICYFTITIKDGTGGNFTEDIDVMIEDIAAGKRYFFTLTAENYLSGFTSSANIAANTTYRVFFTFNGSDRYSIRNSKDYAAVDVFAATESGYAADWIIIDANSPSVGISVDTGNEDADSHFKKFYTAVEHIRDDASWAGFFQATYMGNETRHAGYYVKYANGIADDWISMDLFTRFLWYSTYLHAMECIFLSDYDFYFSSEDNYIANVMAQTYKSLVRLGDGTEAEAYKALMLWQYEYIKSHGTAYNFMAGATQAEPLSNGIGPTGAEPGSGPPAVISPIEEPRAAPPSPSPSVGIWTEPLDIAKSRPLSLGLLALLSIALAVVIVIRKKRAIRIDNDE